MEISGRRYQNISQVEPTIVLKTIFIQLSEGVWEGLTNI